MAIKPTKKNAPAAENAVAEVPTQPKAKAEKGGTKSKRMPLTSPVVIAVTEALKIHKKDQAFWASIAVIYSIGAKYRKNPKVIGALDQVLQGVLKGGGQDGGGTVGAFPPDDPKSER